MFVVFYKVWLLYNMLCCFTESLDGCLKSLLLLFLPLSDTITKRHAFLSNCQQDSVHSLQEDKSWAKGFFLRFCFLRKYEICVCVCACICCPSLVKIPPFHSLLSLLQLYSWGKCLICYLKMSFQSNLAPRSGQCCTALSHVNAVANSLWARVVCVALLFELKDSLKAERQRGNPGT